MYTSTLIHIHICVKLLKSDMQICMHICMYKYRSCFRSWMVVPTIRADCELDTYDYISWHLCAMCFPSWLKRLPCPSPPSISVRCPWICTFIWCVYSELQPSSRCSEHRNCLQGIPAVNSRQGIASCACCCAQSLCGGNSTWTIVFRLAILPCNLRGTNPSRLPLFGLQWSPELAMCQCRMDITDLDPHVGCHSRIASWAA